MKRIFVPVLALIVILAGCGGNKELINQKNMRISSLESRVDSLNTELRQERRECDQAKSDLQSRISDLSGQVETCREDNEYLTKVTLSGEINFGFGSSTLTSEGMKSVDAIWDAVGRYPDRRIYIEGHTDDVPIAESFRHIWRSNWELSAARANAVRHYLMEKYDMNPARVTVCGYGEYHPVGDNETPEGRAKNRRVVISIRDRTE